MSGIEIKAIAFARQKGFYLALTKDLKLVKDEDVEEPSTTDQQKKDHNTNTDAYTFLIILCSGIASLLVQQAGNIEETGNAHEAQKKLCNRYDEEKRVTKAFQEMSAKYNAIKPSVYDDPQSWLTDLEYWNEKMAHLEMGNTRKMKLR